MKLCAMKLADSAHADEYVAYIFENHPQDGNATTFLELLEKPQYIERKLDVRYASHTFIDGKGPLGSVLQVCDILAWNINKMQREKSKTSELNRLFKTPTFWTHHGPADIAKAFHGALDYWDEYDKSGRLHS